MLWNEAHESSNNYFDYPNQSSKFPTLTRKRKPLSLAEPIKPGVLLGLPVAYGGAECSRHAEKVGESGIGFSSGFLRSYSNHAWGYFHGRCPKVVSSEQVALVYSTTIRPTLSWSTGLMRQSAGLVVHLIGQLPNREKQHQWRWSRPWLYTTLFWMLVFRVVDTIQVLIVKSRVNKTTRTKYKRYSTTHLSRFESRHL